MDEKAYVASQLFQKEGTCSALSEQGLIKLVPENFLYSFIYVSLDSYILALIHHILYSNNLFGFRAIAFIRRSHRWLCILHHFMKGAGHDFICLISQQRNVDMSFLKFGDMFSAFPLFPFPLY